MVDTGGTEICPTDTVDGLEIVTNQGFCASIDTNDAALLEPYLRRRIGRNFYVSYAAAYDVQILPRIDIEKRTDRAIDKQRVCQ